MKAIAFFGRHPVVPRSTIPPGHQNQTCQGHPPEGCMCPAVWLSHYYCEQTDGKVSPLPGRQQCLTRLLQVCCRCRGSELAPPSVQPAKLKVGKKIGICHPFLERAPTGTHLSGIHPVSITNSPPCITKALFKLMLHFWVSYPHNTPTL